MTNGDGIMEARSVQAVSKLLIGLYFYASGQLLWLGGSTRTTRNFCMLTLLSFETYCQWAQAPGHATCERLHTYPVVAVPPSPVKYCEYCVNHPWHVVRSRTLHDNR